MKFGFIKNIGKSLWNSHKHNIIGAAARTGKKIIKKLPVPGKQILIKGVDHITK